MHKNHKYFVGIVLLVVIVLIFTPVTLNQLKAGDYPHNIEQAQQLSENGYLYLKANLLFQRVLLVVRDLLPFNFLARISPLLKQIIDIKSYEIAALAVTILMQICIGIILWMFLYRKIQFTDGKVKDWVVGGLTLVLMLLGPITLFSFPERQFFGYFTGNPVHNAPFTLMKLFGVIFFITVTDYVNLQNHARNQWIAIGALILATLAKPNIALSMVPAFLLVFGIIRFKELKDRNLIKWTAVLTFLIALVLISQYIIMYTGDRGEKILIEPFRVMLLTSPNIGSVFFFLLMSIAFPLTFTLFTWRDTHHKVGFQLAWINFFISILFAYFLAEQSDMASANFDWNPMLAIFFLFVVTVPEYVAIMKSSAKKGITTVMKFATTGLLFFHFVCGCAFLYFSAITPFLVR